MWFTKADVKHFKGVALRTFTIVTKSMKKKKKEFRQKYVLQRFCS